MELARFHRRNHGHYGNDAIKLVQGTSSTNLTCTTPTAQHQGLPKDASSCSISGRFSQLTAERCHLHDVHIHALWNSWRAIVSRYDAQALQVH